MNRLTLIAMLESVREQARILQMQAGALDAVAVAALTQLQDDQADAEDLAELEEQTVRCPRCSDTKHQAEAGDVFVCGSCGANHDGRAVKGE